jgi:predicted nuclease of predicted toxin-antitoxin system
VKLLFDQNRSFRLVAQLSEIFPESIHVRDVGPASALDAEVWA